MTPEAPVLSARGRELAMLAGSPLLMGVVNATPDSFSDSDAEASERPRRERVREALGAGAALIDIGGESGITSRPPVAPEEEIDRVCALIAYAAGELGAFVSVDTYKPAV